MTINAIGKMETRNPWTPPGAAWATKNGTDRDVGIASAGVTGGCRPTGIGAQKPPLPFIEGSELDSVPNPSHGVKVKVQVMQRVEGSGGHLAGLEKIAQIRP